jgi:RecA/RadA recombinase
MYIKSIFYGNDNIIHAIIVGDSGHEYVTSIDIDNNFTWCTCPWWVLNKSITTCKHVLLLLENIDYSKMKTAKKFKNFMSGCTTIDTLMGNGFPLGSVTAVFGEPGSGKTILTAQLSLSCIKNLNKDVIILETEGNRYQDFRKLLVKFKDRWEIAEEDIDKHIQFHTVLGDYQSQAIVTLLRMVGYEAEVDKSKKGDKYTVTFKEIKPGLKEENLKNVGIIIIDSLTKPLKASIGHKTQNLPARADLSARFFDKLYQIAHKYGAAIIINHHASIDPMKWGRDFGKIYGGDEVLYNSKYVIELVDSDMAARAKYGETARRVMLIKHPFNSNVGELHPINLKKDWGFTDEE